MSDRVFLTWTDHRRSKNLAPEFGAEYACFESGLPYLLRALVLSVRTLLFLLKRRPTVVIAQNPSLALAVLCCAVKPLLGYVLVVDRHSNFKLDSLDSADPKMRLFHLLSRWSVRRADVTIITNENLCRLVESWGGEGVVLPDRLPSMRTDKSWRHGGPEPFVAVFVASYDDDEPLAELLEAARSTSDIFHVYVTGNYKRAGVIPAASDRNITFTGFLADDMYVALIARADLIVVLTSEEDLLNCGAYEAVVLGKPMMLSDKKAIRAYFDRGAIHVDNSAEGIGKAFRAFPEMREQLQTEVGELRVRLERDWHRLLSTALGSLDRALRLSHRLRIRQ